MNALRLIIFLILFNVIDNRYSVYPSNNPSIFTSVFDCLYAHLSDYNEYFDSSDVLIYHIIPYCRRLDQNAEQDHLLNISLNNIENIITFNELYKHGVTSIQLLDWSAPISIAEQYEMKDLDSMEVFYNCSLPWFGPKCQYRFNYELSLSFDDIVRLNFITRFRISIHPQGFDMGTCYPFLTTCHPSTWLRCLDWREICDGKFDCINGEDEQYCQRLEISECPADTYRCHYGGQCIPLAFVRDGPDSADCLDGSDEMEVYEERLYNFDSRCFTFPMFRCEEHTSRHRRTFPCGDGQYYSSYGILHSQTCYNGRQEQSTSISINRLRDNLESSLKELSNLTLESDLVFLNEALTALPQWYSLITCESASKECLSKWLFKFRVPYAYGKFHFVYLPNRLTDDVLGLVEPNFICFNRIECPAFAKYSIDIGQNNELICCPGEVFNESLITNISVLNGAEKIFLRCSTTGIDQSCSHPSLFHCPISKKCISKHRLVDGISDCYFNEDETFSACQLNDSQRFNCESEQNKCLSLFALHNGKDDCIGREDEITEAQRNFLNGDVPYGLLCDGKTHSLLSKLNETDETNCEYWPCNNPYVRCNTFKNCLNGNDELNCPKMQCILNENVCPETVSTNFFCSPVMNLMAKYSDCEIFNTEDEIYFNSTSNNNVKECFSSDIHCQSLQEICSYTFQNTFLIHICSSSDKSSCDSLKERWKRLINKNICLFLPKFYYIKEMDTVFFLSSQLGYFPAISTSQNNSKIERQRINNSVIGDSKNWYCNRGILINFNDNKGKACLCPPSYFGDQCQWQNQRVSLTLQLSYRVDTFINAIFQVIIMLIDEQRQIPVYHEQITYIPKRDCGTKYNVYLLYPDQPKNCSINYSVHIQIFNKITLTYLASWYLSILSQFLPVNRISTQLFIPNSLIISKLCPLFCGKHGRCVQYINKNLSYFCQCDQGYSGFECNIKHNCSCSSDSFCLTSSICICRLNRFGPKCYLNHSICQTSNNPCQNNGLCIPNDARMGLNKFTCLCTEAFYGTKCENTRSRIDIEINDMKINTMQFVFVHFITAFENADHQRTTQLKKILYDNNRITLFRAQLFHIVLVELTNQTYYLSVLREKFIESENIQTKLLSNYRCFSISELMNTTLLNKPFLYRAKYYPLVCQRNKQLVCFYDEKNMCVCDLDRFANCFTFNRNISYDCQGENICENGGLCFQDNATCPTQLICACPECYYGTKCQFSTRGFVLSLDYILGYHIKPNVSIHQQSFFIKTSIIITTLMLIFGLINGFLSIITFRIKRIRNIGCGLYLLISSWNSLCLIVILLIKFWQLILSQMLIWTNRSYLTLNCILLDMILKVLVAINDWFYGCVAVERVFIVYKGVQFNKMKSKQMAKWVIVSIFIMTIATHIHDPIHRRLIDDIDADEQRTWCLAQYSSATNMFNTFITLLHFLIPFSMNLISPIITIILMARSRSTLQPRTSFKEHLQQQFYQHKHHLIASCALLVLALPRLIISFISGCMKSPRDPWLFLVGYLISFIPSMATFIVFVLSAKKYKEEFNTMIQYTIRHIRTRFHLQSL